LNLCCSQANYDFDVPALVSVPTVRDEFFVQGAQVAMALKRWTSGFADTKACKDTGMAQAPATASHGLEHMKTLTKRLVPPEPQTELPASVAQQLERAWFFGYSARYAAVGTEPGLLGSMRVVFSGEVAILAAPASDVVRFLQKTKRDTSVVALRNFITDLTQPVLEELKAADVPILSGVLVAGSALIVPPGYIVGLMTNSGPVVGLRRCFMHSSKSAVADLQALEVAGADSAQGLLKALT